MSVDVKVSAEFNAEQFEALDLKLGAIHGAVDKLAENISSPETSVAAEVALLRNELGMRFTQLSDNMGKWLAAIALAAADPEDNTAEVQAKIDFLTAELKPEADALEQAGNQPQ